MAVEVAYSHQIWKQPVPFDELPQLLNPEGGYLHNENDPFHFTNLNEVLPPGDYPGYFPEPRLRLRSQHSLELIHNDDQLSLEEVIDRKHSMRMLLADRMKPDLLAALKTAIPRREIRKAIEHLEAWDNSVAVGSRGGVLFITWFELYAEAMHGQEIFASPWSFEQPTTTPMGIADKTLAAKVFPAALDSLRNQYGTWDLAWGDVHRLRHGDLDLPVGGGPGGYGCFRVLWFTDTEDGKRKIRGGDGWQLAVEFSDPPRAYSVLAYGQSSDPESPHHSDQATLFAGNKMKTVAYTEEAIEKTVVRKYRPGE
jgi:acyl-homoserine-lactone acylase